MLSDYEMNELARRIADEIQRRNLLAPEYKRPVLTNEEAMKFVGKRP